MENLDPYRCTSCGQIRAPRGIITAEEWSALNPPQPMATIPDPPELVALETALNAARSDHHRASQMHVGALVTLSEVKSRQRPYSPAMGIVSGPPEETAEVRDAKQHVADCSQLRRETEDAVRVAAIHYHDLARKLSHDRQMAEYQATLDAQAHAKEDAERGRREASRSRIEKLKGLLGFA